MNWVLHSSINVKASPPPLPQPVYAQTSLGNKISPSILLIIGILAVIFFISGLLHLLVRYLMRPSNRNPEEMENATALQGQLQQLFHLHDAGVDQSFIDALPVFLYKAIIGVKDPFDCAVCLCEFEADDKLRLLPKCSHAFHLECIDTWLLSHSTCPLCRRSLLADFSPHCSPLVLVLESGSESSREIVPDSGFSGEVELGPGEIGPKDEQISAALVSLEAKVVAVKLGKFRNVDVNCGAREEGTSGDNSNLDQRRCFSMGSYEYVMDESSLLQVPIKPSKKRPSSKRPRHRLAMSECDCQSRRGFKEFDSSRNSVAKVEDAGDARITSSVQRKESFSISKIWLRSKKEKSTGEENSSRRAFSFRLPLHRQSSEEPKPNAASEIVVSGWEKSGSEIDLDVEIGSCNNSIASLAEEAPSFTRRTLLWIMGRQNKVGDYV